MARSSRRAERGINIWPGFVDALSQLVMVIIFVLLFFTAGQFILTDVLSGRDAALKQLTAQVNQLTNILALERRQNADLKVNLTQLTQSLAALRHERDALAARADTATQQLATAQKDAAAKDQRISQDMVEAADLDLQIENLQAALARIAQALDVSEAKNKAQQVQLADLGQRLNQALASKVEELARSRSEFFGRLRDILGNRPDIRVVGDRFVFQSEVLFAPGSAQLTPEAMGRLKPLADAIRQIAPQLPADLPWVLQVGGHTDKTPIATDRYPSNWELSTARAQSVVDYLIAQGIPAERLSVAGFGQYEPMDPADTPDAYAQNRRIELKLTAQ